MNRRAFTLVELLVVVAIIALLIGIMLPALSRARDVARATVCLANVRNTGLAIQMYANEHGSHYPPSSCGLHGNPAETWWINALQPYASTRLLYRCPCDKAETFMDWADPPPIAQWGNYRWASYSTNSRFDFEQFNRLDAVPHPMDTIYACETPESVIGADHVHPELWFNATAPTNDVAHDRHLGKANYLFADGHVDQLTLEDTWKPGARNLWNPKKAPAWSGPFDY
jgi:prepilin-type processing-associated H-X9-DG protein/prepilin-type N-terminal cleavage/methylation domain-containing protein